ncbi:MAG: ATP-dependent DNA helicase [Cyanobacteria bacterium P01_H01_bin.74]
MTAVLETYFKILEQFQRYERRESQEKMVLAVDAALKNKAHVIIEAGTGSGKSFGYLIPVLHQFLSEDAPLGSEGAMPVVISTATIALQEQLMQKDIPFLTQAAGIQDLNVQLVKGRGNYLCIQKLNELERTVKVGSPTMLHIQYLKASLEEGWTGDLADLEMSVPPELWQEVRSDAEDCLGKKCRYFDQNPYRLARESLEKAHLLVVNHALYLQDAASGQSLLPIHEQVIFDEAHQLKQWALNAFTIRIGKFATQKLIQKIHRRLQSIPDEFHHRIIDSEAALLDLFFQEDTAVSRLYASAEMLYRVANQIVILQDLEQWIGGLDMKQLPSLRPDLIQSDLDLDKARIQREKLKQQLQGLISRWEFFLEANPFEKARVNWISVDRDRLYYELKSTPLNSADILSTQIWESKTGILTSATLAINNQLQFICSDLGLNPACEQLILPSPFNYKAQCVLYLPDAMPLPNSNHYLEACCLEIERVIHQCHGNALILFTSNAAMHQATAFIAPKTAYPVKAQGDMPKNRLIDWFKSTPNSVLFATATFWEGIDIPGDALRCVVIDKIPFASPGDPVNKAMVDYITANGGDWFSEYALPKAIIRLKQGFGRLIRTNQDKGLVCILDARIRKKGYGKIIQRSLPQVTVFSGLDQLPEWVFEGAEQVYF